MRHRPASCQSEVFVGACGSKSGPHLGEGSPGTPGRQLSSVSGCQLLASRAAISVRPGPALLPWRIAYRAFAVSAPHLSLTLVLPELCRIQSGRASGEQPHAVAWRDPLLRRFDLPTRGSPVNCAAGAASSPPSGSGAPAAPSGKRSVLQQFRLYRECVQELTKFSCRWPSSDLPWDAPGEPLDQPGNPDWNGCALGFGPTRQLFLRPPSRRTNDGRRCGRGTCPRRR